MGIQDPNVVPFGLHEQFFTSMSADMGSELHGKTAQAIVDHFPATATYYDLIRLGRAGRMAIKGIGPKRNEELEQWLKKWICPMIVI